jgi:hypothetical protein
LGNKLTLKFDCENLKFGVLVAPNFQSVNHRNLKLTIFGLKNASKVALTNNNLSKPQKASRKMLATLTIRGITTSADHA